MDKPYRCSDLLAVTQGKLAPPPCDLAMGIQIVHCERGVAQAQWVASEMLLNGHGVIVGGLVSAATDAVMAYAIASCLQDHQSFTSIDLQTTYHRPARSGRLDIEARVRQCGRTIAYLVGEVYQEDKLVATSTSSVLIRSSSK